jgi:hypothetical protein
MRVLHDAGFAIDWNHVLRASRERNDAIHLGAKL